MKKIALLITALALVGCAHEGGTNDKYKTDSGIGTSDVTTNDVQELHEQQLRQQQEQNAATNDVNTATPDQSGQQPQPEPQPEQQK